MSLLSSVQTDAIVRKAGEYQGLLESVRQYILDHFGQNGLYAAYFLAAAVAALILYKLVKLSFDLLFFVGLPSAAVSFILSLFLPYSFFHLLPITSAVLMLGLIIKNVGLSKG